MDKKQYLYELAKQLKDLEQEEYDEALRYLEEYFDEAGVDNEQQVIEELGSPTKYAAQIKADISSKSTYQRDTQTSPKSSMKKSWMIILGICALPIAAPLTFAVIAVLFALCLVIFAFTLAGAVLITVGIIEIIPLFISSFSILGSSGSDGLLALGFSIVLLGILLLCVALYYAIIKRAFPAFTRFCGNLFQRLKGKLERSRVYEKQS